MEHFVESFDPVQIRYTGLQFRRLLEATIQGAENAGKVKSPCLPTLLI